MRQLVEDERGQLSSARVGLWLTVCVAVAVIGVDVHLTLAASTAFVPNTVYAVLATMFTAFASWAAGPRIAAYLAPQIGQIASGIGAARRNEPPFAGMDVGEDDR